MPDTTDKDADLIAEIQDNLKLAYQHQQKFANEAKEDIRFALGDQWTDEEREKLLAESRPCLTFNKIRPIVNLIVGHMRQNDARLEVAPEGGEDKKFSAVMDKALDYIDKQSNMAWNLLYQFAAGCRAGRAWVEFYLDHENDPIFGELKSNNLGPFAVYPDPNGEAYDLSDCEYIFKVKKFSKATLKQIFPKKKAEIDALEQDPLAYYLEPTMGKEGDSDNYGQDIKSPGAPNYDLAVAEEGKGDNQQLTTIEYWHKKRVERWFLYDTETGGQEEFETEEEANARKREINLNRQAQQDMTEMHALVAGTMPPPRQEYECIIKSRSVVQMQASVMAGGIILSSGISPFEPHSSKFPFFQFIFEYNPEAESSELRVQGIVRCIKDSQREVNKARSQFLNILNTSANSGWIGDDDALSADQWIELKNLGASPGIIIKKKKGAILDRIHPVEPSLATQVREKSADDSFKTVSGINSDLLSVDANASPSGRAIALRIRQAVTILEPVFMNFRYTKRLIGEFLLEIIPILMDTAKLKKILGLSFLNAESITDGELRAFLTMIKDGRYDVRIGEQGFTKTLREETFENLMLMMEKGMPLPPDVVLEFTNIPNQKEVIKKVQEYQAQQAQMAQAMQASKQAGANKQQPQLPQGELI